MQPKMVAAEIRRRTAVHLGQEIRLLTSTATMPEGPSRLCSGGTPENSSAFQRRVSALTKSSRAGTENCRPPQRVNVASLQNLGSPPIYSRLRGW